MESTSETDDSDTVSLRSDPELERQLEEVAACFRDAETLLVASHEEPDGDAMGAMLGLGNLLDQLGKEVIRFNHDPVPYNFEFLSGADEVTDEVPAGADVDVVVLLDCSSVERLGDAFPGLEVLAPDEVVVIDHHATLDESTADRYLHDEDAAATGELIYRLVEQLGASLSTPMADCLYCALMTDTGSFQYSNTVRTTFRIAGELLDAGVDAWKMTSQLYENEPLERIQLLAEVLDTLRVS
ncbi:MAG: bifunctional oligoribonuclease/PAP phosphatase NrnA, partial [Bradymonadaceae bacterium]